MSANRESIHVYPEPIGIRGDQIRLSARIVQPSHEDLELWFELPLQYEQAVTGFGNALVLATVFLAMRRARTLWVHDQVSPSLLRNLEEFQAAYQAWHPQHYQAIDVRGDNEDECSPAPAGDLVIAAFSGGLDSSFSVYRHTKGLAGRRNVEIGACLMVHGFDIPVRDTECFERACSKARQMLDSLELPLIPLRTNLKKILNPVWRYEHGAALAACLHLFADGFAGALMGGTYQYSRTELISHGSNPLTDPLLASNSFFMLHDGAEFFRPQKANILLEWPEAMEHLRVCWEGEDLAGNCGICSKCIRMITGFWAMGVDAPKSFTTLPGADDLRNLKLTREDYLDPVREIIAIAKANGLHDEPWVGDLETCLARNQRRFEELAT